MSCFSREAGNVKRFGLTPLDPFPLDADNTSHLSKRSFCLRLFSSAKTVKRPYWIAALNSTCSMNRCSEFLDSWILIDTYEPPACNLLSGIGGQIAQQPTLLPEFLMATSTVTGTVIGVFEDQSKAQQAVADLRRAGYTEEQIGVVSQHRDSGTTADSGTKIEEGAAAGLATGAGIGALWGLGILSNVLPGIGPAIFGGTLGVILSSAAAGAAAAGIGGALVGLGISDDDAKYYEGEFKSGRTIVTVQGGPKADQARSVLTQYGAYDRSSARR
jgi:hypothetical protein